MGRIRGKGSGCSDMHALRRRSRPPLASRRRSGRDGGRGGIVALVGRAASPGASRHVGAIVRAAVSSRNSALPGSRSRSRCGLPVPFSAKQRRRRHVGGRFQPTYRAADAACTRLVNGSEVRARCTGLSEPMPLPTIAAIRARSSASTTTFSFSPIRAAPRAPPPASHCHSSAH